MSNLNEQIIEAAAEIKTNSVPETTINALVIEWCNNPEAEVDSDGDIWLGNTWADDDKKAEFLGWLNQ